MLSPRLAALHRDAFVLDDGPRSSVDLAAHRGAPAPHGLSPFSRPMYADRERRRKRTWQVPLSRTTTAG
jgi:hypothetical protein